MIHDGEYSGSLDVVGYRGMVRKRGRGAITAGAFPAKPPSNWFANPRLRQLTPLTIDQEGRVSGHIASWQQSHIGMAGSIKPPRSRSRYAFFQTGQVETLEGDMVNVGQITLTGGHAPLNASVADTVAHYDNTRSAVMDVAVFEDKHGIAVAGALRPNVSDDQLREIRASAVSGDWRPINGNMELVAVCAVNVPGFPIPRARVASGTPVALVAAGTEPLVALSMRRSHRSAEVDPRLFQRTMRTMHSRVERLERQLAGQVLDNRSALDDAIVAAAAKPKNDRRQPGISAAANRRKSQAQLRARVHGTQASAGKAPTADELRARVHGTQASASDPRADLRKRVHKS